MRKLLLATCLILAGCASTPSKQTLSQTTVTQIELGLGYLQQKQYPQAKAALLQALQEAPNNASTLDAMAYYYQLTQDNTTADSYYQKAIAASPNSAAAKNNYGAFLCRMKQYDKANDYLLQAANTKNYTNNANAFANAGLCAMMNHQPQEAVTYFKKALDVDPQQQTALQALSQLEKDPRS